MPRDGAVTYKKRLRRFVKRTGRRTWAGLWRWRGRWAGLQIPEDQLRGHIANTSVFFMLGSGRSGTYMLSHLLNHAEGTAVFHEPDHVEDVGVLQAAICSTDAARDYVMRFRRYRIAQRIRDFGLPVYGEVTGTLRYHGRALAEAFPDARMLILTRDGRDVIRSLMGMPFYTPGARGLYYTPGERDPYNLHPGPSDPFCAEWPTLSRFAKTCWLWRSTYDHLLALEGPPALVRFESLLKDYAYFEERVLDPLAVRIPRATWSEFTSKPRNATPQHGFPHWTEWPEGDGREFKRICGPLMERLGYEL